VFGSEGSFVVQQGGGIRDPPTRRGSGSGRGTGPVTKAGAHIRSNGGFLRPNENNIGRIEDK